MCPKCPNSPNEIYPGSHNEISINTIIFTCIDGIRQCEHKEQKILLFLHLGLFHSMNQVYQRVYLGMWSPYRYVVSLHICGHTYDYVVPPLGICSQFYGYLGKVNFFIETA